jgi:hypothetical protein
LASFWSTLPGIVSTILRNRFAAATASIEGQFALVEIRRRKSNSDIPKKAILSTITSLST